MRCKHLKISAAQEDADDSSPPLVEELPTPGLIATHPGKEHRASPQCSRDVASCADACQKRTKSDQQVSLAWLFWHLVYRVGPKWLCEHFGQIVLCCREADLCIAGLLSVSWDSSTTTPSPTTAATYDNQKMSPDLATCPLDTNLLPIKNDFFNSIFKICSIDGFKILFRCV